jgi:hypothetical protein
MRLRLSAAALAVAVGCAGTAAAAAVSEDQFQARTTADLVAICATDKSDPLYTEAQNFCHGFIVGTYRALVAVNDTRRPKRKWFCEENLPSTRNETVAGFVAWAKATPDAGNATPTDGMLRYLIQTGHCK